MRPTRWRRYWDSLRDALSSARHVATGHGRPWAGTPQEFADLAEQVHQIVQSASTEPKAAWISVVFDHGRETKYNSPADFVSGLLPGDIRRVASVMIGCTGGSGLGLTVHVVSSRVPGIYVKPFVRAEGPERAAVEGVADLVTGLLSGPRFVRQGLRVPGRQGWIERWRARAGWVGTIVITAAVTATVTVIVTLVLTRLFSH
jgi:hypothetical protein